MCNSKEILHVTAATFVHFCFSLFSVSTSRQLQSTADKVQISTGCTYENAEAALKQYSFKATYFIVQVFQGK
jgi:hypothetical protein